MHRTLIALLAGTLWLLPTTGAVAQPLCGDPPNMLIVVDRSGSMTGLSGSTSKWSHATTAVKNLTTKFAGQIRFALMVFPGPGGDCDPGITNVGINLNNHGAIAAFLNSTYPTGMTPLGATMKNAHSFLTQMPSNKDKYVLLITDGSETCNGQALNWVQALYGAKIKTYVVGFGTGVSASELNGLAIAGGTPLSGGTKYYQADNSTQLNTALQAIGSQVSCCGNGKLDAGEKCDKAIPKGATGACPKDSADCDDKNACTNDYPTGSECAVVCGHSPVTAPKHSDGCCPPGANSVNDNDCKASCGNGVLESGEVCDPGIKSGTGKCKTAADCDDKNACTKDQIGGSACNVTCQYTTVQPDSETKDGCCPSGYSLAGDADCLPNCGPDKRQNCVDLCQGVKCPDGHYCNNGKCIPWPKNGDGTSATPTEAGTSSGGDGGPYKPSQPNQPGTGPGFVGSEGCACRVEALPSPMDLPLALLLVAALALVRRRR